ncbi:uncharacterized protein LOC135383853 isoform X2 [Ornithodoros turicata]|uniref:uncharacterized protein LOC135383853 isoform X2 n=1 Tax=Ornithodoros turicata TaxID=34597 RepID=UPI003138E175
MRLRSSKVPCTTLPTTNPSSSPRPGSSAALSVCCMVYWSHLYGLFLVARRQPHELHQTAVEKSARFYKSCLDIATGHKNGIQDFVSMLSAGNISWPTVPGRADLVKAMVYANVHWGCRPLLDIDVLFIPNATVGVHLWSSSFPSTWHTIRSQMLNDSSEVYYVYFDRFTTSLSGTTATRHAFAAFVAAEDAILGRLANRLVSKEERIVMNETEFVRKLDENKAFNIRNWRTAFEDLLNISQNEEIVVSMDAGYFDAFASLASTLGPNSMLMFLAWGIVQELGGWFDGTLAALKYGGEQRASKSAKSRCRLLVQSYMGIAMSAPYAFHAITKTKVGNVSDISRRLQISLKGTYGPSIFSISEYQRILESTHDLVGIFGEIGNGTELDRSYVMFADMTNNLADNLQKAVAAFRAQPESNLPVRTRYMRNGHFPRVFDAEQRELHVWPPLLTDIVFADGMNDGLRYGGLASFIAAGFLEALYSTDGGPQFFTGARKCFDDIPRKRSSPISENVFYDAISLPILWKAYVSAAQDRDVRLAYWRQDSENQVFFLVYCYLRCSGTSTKSKPETCNFPVRNFPTFYEVFLCGKKEPPVDCSVAD